MPYISHKYGKTYYTKKSPVKGRNKKTPLVFLHGGPGGTHDPKSALFNLSNERDVYLYDQIGGGKSSATEKKYWNIKTFVDELSILIEAWGLKEFHLAGGSWGTTLALEYYLRKRGKGVKSLIFQSPMFSAYDWQKDANKLIKKLSPQHQKVIKYCLEIGATDSKVFEEATFEYYANFVFRNRRKLKESNKKKNPNGKKVYLHMWGPSEFSAEGTLKNYDRTDSLARIKVPTLLLCGEYDEATPSTAKKYTRKIRNASFTEIEGASHSIMKEKPNKMLKVFREHLKATEK